jgi:hypothetical protein
VLVFRATRNYHGQKRGRFHNLHAGVTRGWAVHQPALDDQFRQLEESWWELENKDRELEGLRAQPTSTLFSREPEGAAACYPEVREDQYLVVKDGCKGTKQLHRSASAHGSSWKSPQRAA